MTTTTLPTTRFTRTRLTWQAYLMISFYSYLLNVLGPLTPFLRDELGLSYTLASLHFSAFAVGMIITGLMLRRVEDRFGMKRLVWGGGLGMGLGTLLLTLGRVPPLTIGGAFLMGLAGVYLVSLMNMVLAERHGEHSAVAFSESAMIASLFSALAPVAVGFFARTGLSWRAALWLVLLALPLLWAVFGRDPVEKVDAPSGQAPTREAQASPAQRGDRQARGFLGLPFVYWLYLLAILLAVAIEFCIIFWAADYLETVSGLARPDAALAVSAFLGAMLVGRGIVSRLLFRMRPALLLLLSLLLTGAGFLLFWLSPGPLAAVLGLVAAGIGNAGVFPILNSLALAQAGGQMVAASGRISLAIGVAVLLLPLLLGRIADVAGIRAAYGLVAALIVLCIGVSQWADNGFGSRMTRIRDL